MTTEATKPMTNAERQRAFRARKAGQATTEVRGVFAHPDDHPTIREAVAKAKAAGLTDADLLALGLRA